MQNTSVLVREPLPPISRVLAALAIPVILFGWGCWATVAPHGGLGIASGKVELIDAEKRLSPEEICAAQDAEAAARLVSLSHQSGIDPRETLYRSLPDAHRVIAMLSRDRDIDEYEEYAARGGILGNYYAKESLLARQMRPLRPRYEAVYASAFAALTGRDALLVPSVGPSADYLGGEGRKKPYIASPDEVWFPPRSELRKAHQYALDIFFFNVERSGDAVNVGLNLPVLVGLNLPVSTIHSKV